MQPVKITERVHWVGALHPELRNFHGVDTPEGTSYNSYLVVGEKKIALIDVVKKEKVSQLIDRISKVIDPRKIDYIVVNHAEPDHSSGLMEMLAVTNADVVTTEKGKTALEAHFHRKFKTKLWKHGDQLKLGAKTLQLFETPMLHWPESTMTYLLEDKLLFSMDAFGQHIPSEERFDDRTEEAVHEAAEYYANIVMPFGKAVLKVLRDLKDFELAAICPSHGVIWRKQILEIVSKYYDWASGKKENKVLIVYDSMWGGTEKIAQALARGAKEGRAAVKIYNLANGQENHIVADLLDSKALLVGSPTQNTMMMPRVEGFLSHVKGLRPANLKTACFSTYGWGGGSYKAMAEWLKQIGSYQESQLKANYVPDDSILEKAEAFGKQIAESLQEPSPKKQ